MVDVMTSNIDALENRSNEVDLEDGELPEEGEISDDEEPQRSHLKASPARPSSGRTPSKGHSDHDGRAAMDVGDRAIDAWGAKVSGQTLSPKQRTEDPFGDTDYRSEGDKDYRNPFGEDDFGDSDYRMDRRRRRSPSPGSGEWGDRPFKRMRGGFGTRGGFGRGGSRFAGRDTGHVICKFYREGYCRDEDHCAFSHQAEDSLRKPELCKWYKNGFCKKGLHCNSLHGEFPCIRFHRGECETENCGYSHLPLTDYTRPIVEKVNKEEEEYNKYYGRASTNPVTTSTPALSSATNGAAPLRVGVAPPIPQVRGPGPLPPLPMPPNYAPPTTASGQSPPQGGPPPLPMPPGFSLAAKRRVLLPSGPNAPLTNPLLGTGSPDPSAPLPPPSVVVPTLGRAAYSPPTTVYGSPYYGTSIPPQVSTAEPIKEEPTPVSAGFNISQMLAQFTGTAPSTSTMDESPASPPPAASLGSSARSIPFSREVVWRLLPVSAPPTYSTVDPAVASQCSQADPRLSKLLSSQFDAVSSLISAAPKATLPPPKLVDPRTLADPRLRASTDPRPKASWMPTISS